MATDYDPEDTWHDQVKIPDDGDLADAASLEGLQQLADNAKHVRGLHTALSGHVAYTDVDNAFTEDQHIDGQLFTTDDVNSGGHLKATGSVYTGEGGQVVSDTHVLD